MVPFSKTFRQTMVLVAWTVAFACVGRPQPASAQAPQQFTGVGTADVATAIAAFKAALGGADNGAAVGSQPTGFRQVTWDDVPDQYSDPNQFPYDYYSRVSPRGMVVYLQNGTPFMQVSANAGNATSTPTLFGLGSLLTAYSPQRIFTGGTTKAPGDRVPGVILDFYVPGSLTFAQVSGFGAVFTDVNLPNTTSISFYDKYYKLLGTFFVPPASGHNSVSFLGVKFPGREIGGVAIALGTETIDNTEDATHDVVALDDVIFDEPQLPPPPPPPVLTVTSPTTATTFGPVGPFLSLSGTVLDGGLSVVSDNVQTFVGTIHRTSTGPLANWSVDDIQLGPGQNALTLTALNDGGSTRKTLTVDSSVFGYYLAEGSTGGFFDTDISIANPAPVAAPVTLTFLREDGNRVVQTDTIGATSQKVYHVDSIPGLESTAFSTIVISENRIPLIVERTMFWDGSYYGGKSAASVNPSTTWYFAEGVENSFFTTYVLLENPNQQAADATLTFQLDAGEPVVQHVPLAPLSRVTVDTGSIPALVGRSFGLMVQASDPIVAERSTYFETTPTQLWAGGHGSPGVDVPSYTRYFAEGATGSFRDTFLLLNNPGDDTFPVQLDFFLPGVFPYFIPDVMSVTQTLSPHSRLTLPLNTLPQDRYGLLTNAEFGIRVISPEPIVAERAMYWHGAPGPWADGTTTFGVRDVGTRWGFAEGRVGGPLDYHTYIRILYTPFPYGGPLFNDVTVTFLKADGTTIVQTYDIRANGVLTIDANAVPGLQNESFGTIIESSSFGIATERSMYWNSGGVFWAGGITTAGTRLP